MIYKNYSFNLEVNSFKQNQYIKLIDILEDKKPQRICALGLGNVSNIIEQYSNKYNSEILLIEDNYNYNYSRTVILPIKEETDININDKFYNNCNKYEGLEELLKNEERFDLIIIDGPPGWGFRENYQYSRVQLLSFVILNKLNNNCTVLFHDSERNNAKNTLNEFEKLLEENKYKFEKEILQESLELTIYNISSIIKIWCSYHDDKLKEEFNLEDTNIIKLFNTNNLRLEKNNINDFNKYLAEFVTYYYVWKNQIKSDYVGFCHYRRYFHNISLEELNEDKAVQCEYLWTRTNYEKNLIWQLKTWCTEYDIYWNPKLISYFTNYIYENYNKDIIDISFNIDVSKTSCRSMYIFKWDDFNKFCEILFGYLNYLIEKENDNIFNIFEKLWNVSKNNYTRNPAIFLEKLSSVIVELFFNPFSTDKKAILTHYDNLNDYINQVRVMNNTGLNIYNVSEKIKLEDIDYETCRKYSLNQYLNKTFDEIKQKYYWLNEYTVIDMKPYEYLALANENTIFNEHPEYVTKNIKDLN